VKTPDLPGDVGGTVTGGGTATFTIVLTNQGPGVAHDVQLNDALPASLTWSLSSPGNPPCSVVANQLSCSFGDINAGDSRTVVVTASVSVAQCTPAPGQGSVTFNNPQAQGTASNALPD